MTEYRYYIGGVPTSIIVPEDVALSMIRFEKELFEFWMKGKDEYIEKLWRGDEQKNCT